ncbi:glycosyltransferase family 2 protein [Pseudomonas putida]|uniref:glycosyltransferase family 2 protein n=1 Tax=Pseudomonas putida TaxID=303 RepID=UPI0018E68143|nr:glycosyltransferase family 2 protein [Pseudomonas putida]MBI6923832.1 glycosyltransferase family 2 protein [Pseudomonas putida]
MHNPCACDHATQRLVMGSKAGIFMAEGTRLAIGAIVKNEFPYLLEWIAYHKLQGVSKFYIADNNSSDNTSELLLALHDLGEICVIPFPMVGDNPSQLRAYSMMLQKYHDEYDWIAFIDADEFISQTDSSVIFSEYLSSIPEDVGALALNWAIYGSAGEKKFKDELTINRFNKRAEQDFHINNHFKSVVSSRACFSAPLNPHRFHLSDEFRFVHTDMSDVARHDTLGIKVSKSVIWDKFRLNHYNIRSSEEFFDRKATRGLADSVRVRNNVSFFNQRDRNEVEDSSAVSSSDSTRSEIESLVSRLAEIGYHYGACGSVNSEVKNKIDIERVIVESGSVRILGSGYQIETKNPISEFKVIVGEVDSRVQMVRKRNNRKMQPALGMDSSCGFDIAASYVGADPDLDAIRIRAYDATMQSYDEILLKSQPYSAVSGYVDNIEVTDHNSEIHGWFKLERDIDASVRVLIRSGRHEFIEDKVSYVDRPDVHAKRPDVPLKCGFVIELGQKLTPPELSEVEVYIVAGIAATRIKKTRKALDKLSALRP